MKIAVDTNILADAEGLNEPQQQEIARGVLLSLRRTDLVIPVQVLGELFTVLVRKARWPADRARQAVTAWTRMHPTIATTEQNVMAAIELATAHRLAFWDAVIVAAASGAGCTFLLSEDMHHGFTWQGLTIANPFSPDLPPLLAALLRR